MSYEYNIQPLANGAARLATEAEIKREDANYTLASDIGLVLVTDQGDEIVPNTGEFGYTHPNLHRRIDVEAVGEGMYPFMHYAPDGTPYNQSITLGVWDRRHSYRTTTTYTHDEESEVCEIP